MLGRNPKLLGSHLLGNGPELGLRLTLSGPKLLRLSKLLGWPLELDFARVSEGFWSVAGTGQRQTITVTLE